MECLEGRPPALLLSAAVSVDDQACSIVPAASRQGGLDNPSGRVRRGGIRIVPEVFRDAFVQQTVDKTVGAQEEQVAGFDANGAELGFDELVAGTEGLLERAGDGCAPATG